MKRWLILSLGLAIAAGAAWVLLAGGPGAPPLDRIDDASRARLEAVLDDADGGGAHRR